MLCAYRFYSFWRILYRQKVSPWYDSRIAECYITIAEDYREDFRNHVEKRLKYFPDAVTADKAAEIIGYTKTTVISHIRDKHISAVLISGKYIVPKSALVDFIVSDAAFEIVHKSTWHMNTILRFAEDE